jgi:hypothetical protein
VDEERGPLYPARADVRRDVLGRDIVAGHSGPMIRYIHTLTHNFFYVYEIRDVVIA